MAWKFNWWSCSAQKVANSEASRCLRHLKCRSTSSFSPPRQILNHVEKTYCQKISNHKPWSTSPPALSPSLSLPALVSASTSIFSFAFFAKIRLWHSAESGKSSRKKVAVLLDFVQMRRGRPCLQTKSPSEKRKERKRTTWTSCSTFVRAEPSRRTRRSTCRCSLSPVFV